MSLNSSGECRLNPFRQHNLGKRPSCPQSLHHCIASFDCRFIIHNTAAPGIILVGNDQVHGRIVYLLKDFTFPQDIFPSGQYPCISQGLPTHEKRFGATSLTQSSIARASLRISH